MVRKTQGVYDLVQEVLQTMPKPYGEDVIEDVCLAIEKTPHWHQQYQKLGDTLSLWVVNNWIGQYVKRIVGMATIREVAAKRSSLITACSKLTP